MGKFGKARKTFHQWPFPEWHSLIFWSEGHQFCNRSAPIHNHDAFRIRSLPHPFTGFHVQIPNRNLNHVHNVTLYMEGGNAGLLETRAIQ